MCQSITRAVNVLVKHDDLSDWVISDNKYLQQTASLITNKELQLWFIKVLSLWVAVCLKVICSPSYMTLYIMYSDFT